MHLSNRIKRQDLDKGRQICSDAELLAGDRHGEVSAKRSSQLEPDGVGCSAVKDSDTQAVFEPAIEQFDLPAVPIQFGDDGGAGLPLIGPECQLAPFQAVTSTPFCVIWTRSDQSN
jgi:hypothetical protein